MFFGRFVCRSSLLQHFILITAAFPDSEIDDFYTDSVNDEFLFPLAKRVFLVKKHEIRQIK